MKKLLRLSFLLCTIVVIISSCHKSPKQTQYIPKDVSYVLSINPKSLQDKLADSHINMDSLFNAFRDTNSVSASAGIKSWEDLKSSGIDWENNIYLFVSMNGSVMNGMSSSTGIVAAMHSQSDFESFLKKQQPNIGIKKSGNYSYAVLTDGSMVGWNGDIAILSNVTSNHASSFQSSPNTFNNNDTVSAQKQLAVLFSQKEDQSVASISQFNDMMSEKADMQFWTNYNSTLAMIPFIGITKAADLFKDSYSAGTINFEDGKAVMKSKFYCGKDLKTMLDKYKGPTVDVSMIDKYPTPINGFAAFSFNPKLIGDIINYIGVDATANQYFQQLGFTLDDVLKAFKGDFAILVSDIGMQEKPNEFAPGETIKKPTAKFIFNAAIGDKAAYDKIVSALSAKGLMVQKNGQYVPLQMNGYVMNADNKNLIVASDDALLQQYKSGNAGRASVPADVMNNTKGNAAVFYADLTGILNAFSISTSANDTSSNATLNLAKQTFKNAVATAGNFNGKSVDGDFELRIMNDKENSLATLVKFFLTVAKQNKFKQQNNRMSIDSIPHSNDTMSH